MLQTLSSVRVGKSDDVFLLTVQGAHHIRFTTGTSSRCHLPSSHCDTSKAVVSGKDYRELVLSPFFVFPASLTRTHLRKQAIPQFPFLVHRPYPTRTLILMLISHRPRNSCAAVSQDSICMVCIFGNLDSGLVVCANPISF
jgi:hypothetical protein